MAPLRQGVREKNPGNDPGVSSFRIHPALNATGTLVMIASRFLAIALFGLSLIPAVLTAQDPAVKAPAPAAGRATREIDEWNASFTSQTKKVEELQKRIEQDVPKAMDAASTNIERALTEYLKDPSEDNRIGLQKVTEDELRRFVESLKPIVGQRKVLETAISDLETKLRDRAAGLQSESNKLNAQLPVLKTALAETRTENHELKKKFAVEPTAAELERELLKRFRDEQRQEDTLLTVERKGQFRAMAAKQLQKKAEQINVLLAETEVTLDNIEITVEMAQSSADDIYCMFHGLGEMHPLPPAGGDRLQATLNQLSLQLSIVDLRQLIGPKKCYLPGDLDAPDGPATPRVDADFIKWLQDY
jgi:hypothetical protein